MNERIALTHPAFPTAVGRPSHFARPGPETLAAVFRALRRRQERRNVEALARHLGLDDRLADELYRAARIEGFGAAMGRIERRRATDWQ